MPVTAASSTRPSPGPARLPDVHILAGPVTEESDADVLAVPLVAGRDAEADVRLGHGGAEVAAAVGIDLLRMAVREKAKGEAGEVIAVPVLAEGSPVQQVLLVGIGDGSPVALRRAGAALARKTRGRSLLATTVTAAADDDGVRAFVEGLLLGSYSFSRKSEDKRPAALAAAGLVASGATAPQAVHRATTVARATAIARDLTNTPSNEKSPAVAGRAGGSARPRGRPVGSVRDEATLARRGLERRGRRRHGLGSSTRGSWN